MENSQTCSTSRRDKVPRRVGAAREGARTRGGRRAGATGARARDRGARWAGGVAYARAAPDRGRASLARYTRSPDTTCWHQRQTARAHSAGRSLFFSSSWFTARRVAKCCRYADGSTGAGRVKNEKTSRFEMRSVPETTCDFYPNNPNNPEKTGIIRQKTAESSG